MAGVREDGFGPSGRRLPVRALARFVVLAGAAPDAIHHLLNAPANAPTPATAPDLRAGDVPWLRIDLDRAIATAPRLAKLTDLVGFCAGLDRCWDAQIGAGLARGLVWGGPSGLDTAWLTGLLVHQAPLEAVVFEHAQWGATAFDWPLRIGLPPSPAGVAMLPSLQTGWFRDLYEPLIVRNTEPVDLLLFPGPLSQALRSARRGSRRRASAVVVLGPADGPAGPEAMREGALNEMASGAPGRETLALAAADVEALLSQAGYYK